MRLIAVCLLYVGLCYGVAYRQERRICWGPARQFVHGRHVRFGALGCDVKVGTAWRSVEDSGAFYMGDACGQRLRICSEEDDPLNIPES